MKPQQQYEMIFSKLPPIEGRYIVFDTETTGLDPNENNIIEIAAVEIEDGKLTGNQFHTFLEPRYPINKAAQEKHHMNQGFFQSYYHNIYISSKDSLQNFLDFVNDSLLFAHNSSFDMAFINNELKYWNLPEIPHNKFRCTMKYFKDIIFPFSPKKNYSLSYCCEYFKLTSPKENFHSAIYDSFMTARMLCNLYIYEEREINKRFIYHNSHKYIINDDENKSNYTTDAHSETNGKESPNIFSFMNKEDKDDLPMELDYNDLSEILKSD